MKGEQDEEDGGKEKLDFPIRIRVDVCKERIV